MQAAPLTESGTYVIFDLQGETMGVDVRHVREILGMQRVSRMPDAPPGVTGVIDLRGRCVPIVDLAPQLGLHGGTADEDARIVVFEVPTPGGSELIGTVAERVRDVVRIDPAGIEPRAGRPGAAGEPQGVIGATRRDGELIFVLDIGHFLMGYLHAGASDGFF